MIVMNTVFARAVVACAIVAFAAPAQQAPAKKARRALPDDNLAYPILITIKNGTWSGFYVDGKDGVYLVTAKHVLFDPATGKLQDTSFELLSYSSDQSDPTPNVVSVDTTKTVANAVVAHPSQDVAVMKVFATDPRTPNVMSATPGVTVRSRAKLGFITLNPQTTANRFDDVLVGNEVILMGYPTSLGLQTMPEIDARRPLLRKGIIAGQNPRTRSIILDCPVYFGNSGGPVIEVDPENLGFRFNIIGIVSKYVPYAEGGKTFLIMANSGYSVATPMDYVLDLIQ